MSHFIQYQLFVSTSELEGQSKREGENSDIRGSVEERNKEKGERVKKGVMRRETKIEREKK